MLSNAVAFYQAVSEDWEQGDIVRDITQGENTANLAVLLTPQCDIVYEKADFLLLILSSDFKTSFQKVIDPNNKLNKDQLDGFMELSKGKLTEVLNNILHHLRGATSYRFYYLPGHADTGINIEHTYLDFQRILTISKETLDSWKGKRIANINDPFRSQLLSRYVSYMGRIGAPDFQKEDVLNLLTFSGLLFRKEHISEFFKNQTKDE
jgi:hypothetical protein